MTIFINSEFGIRAFNFDKIYNVYQIGSVIKFYYNDGDYIDTESGIAPAVKIADIKYESEIIAFEDMKDFYKACRNSAGAFYFKGVY